MPFMDGHELASAGATRPHPDAYLPVTLSSGSLLKGRMLEDWEAWTLDGANKKNRLSRDCSLVKP
jgi:hypothetical protein